MTAFAGGVTKNLCKGAVLIFLFKRLLSVGLTYQIHTANSLCVDPSDFEKRSLIDVVPKKRRLCNESY